MASNRRKEWRARSGIVGPMIPRLPYSLAPASSRIRLSIIDLTQAGRQPIANEDGKAWVVFNGEIYNHRELRRNLEQRGHAFRGHSDSEILPHLYEEEGSAFLEQLRGMFAFAMYRFA